MDRNTHLSMWDDFHAGELGCVPLEKTLAHLTPEQAARRPKLASGEGHSIWQIVNHLILVREVAVAKASGGAPITDAEFKRRDFELPADISQAAWTAALGRLGASQKNVRAVVADGRMEHEQFRSMVPHDSFHIGQIEMLRGFFGTSQISS